MLYDYHLFAAAAGGEGGAFFLPCQLFGILFIFLSFRFPFLFPFLYFAYPTPQPQPTPQPTTNTTTTTNNHIISYRTISYHHIIQQTPHFTTPTKFIPTIHDSFLFIFGLPVFLPSSFFPLYSSRLFCCSTVYDVRCHCFPQLSQAQLMYLCTTTTTTTTIIIHCSFSLFLVSTI
ncbi:hypothetical protein GALMADRAFT_890699 [Galerina marginata CBS 339.88]|uniref:Uncharacterized protein n=1 Tax=Galerina marginata (strain CBS 339.88) TaxID=685588 RepID=A0A067SR62_GALM3|nr:hypothetical protein GALMADRAFT_890699 [Galerina marginata CBS 339.88]